MALIDLLNDFLPLNREERFWSATVLSTLVMPHLERFLDLLAIGASGSSPDRAGRFEPENVLFFPEYSLKKSNGPRRLGRKLKISPERDVTPDLIAIEPALPALYALEVKFFDAVDTLRWQMATQYENVVAPIARELGIEKVYQLALVPGAKMRAVQNQDVSCISWEQIRDLASPGETSFFHACLETALGHYDKVCTVHGLRTEGQLTAREILALERQGEAVPRWVGRRSGLRGRRLADALAADDWEKHHFAVNWSAEKPPSRNWFSLDEFRNALHRYGRLTDNPS